LTSQLVLPLSTRPALGRADFIVGPGNAQATAFIDAWPDWPVAVAAIIGPAGSGKTHLASIWQAASGARICAAADLEQDLPIEGPIVVEDIDSLHATGTRDTILFALIEGATRRAPVLLTGRDAPSTWACTLPDLASRFSALLSLPVWSPDEELLKALARKLLADRQLLVGDAVVERMVRSLERSPASIRDFIAMADTKALSETRPVNLGLVRELLVKCDERLS
jgi:chromosomal replication initiation ATPase DnaA